MQIAPVSVVFALAAAGALGMAVKDTIVGPKVSLSFEDEVASLDQLAAEQQYQREELERMRDEAELMREEAAYEEQRQAKRADVVRTIFGPTLATVGPGLGPLQLGMSYERYVVAAPEVEAALTAADVTLEMSGGTNVDALILATSSDPTTLCAAATTELTTRWGSPSYSGDSMDVWWNPTTGERVGIDLIVECGLVFDRAQKLDRWLSRALALGKLKTVAAVDKASRSWGSADRSETAFAWTEPGLEAARGPTQVFFELEGDAVSVATISVDGEPAKMDALEAKLRAMYGEPRDDYGTYVWPAQKLTYDRSHRRATLTFSGEVTE